MSQRTEADRIQDLIDALNEIPGIEFTEDGWNEKAPNNFGVVELDGEARNDYADGIKIAQAFTVRITIYVSGGSHRWINEVQRVLKENKLRYSMPSRQYLNDIGKVSWVWNTQIRMPVTM